MHNPLAAAHLSKGASRLWRRIGRAVTDFTALENNHLRGRPAANRGEIVLMDNLPVHRVAGVAEAIEGAGATLIYPFARFSTGSEHWFRAIQSRV